MSTEQPSPQRYFRRLTEPWILFPIVILLVLGFIWGTTWNLIRSEQSNADKAAYRSVREQIDTYQAHVVRILAEIDQALKFVKYAYEARGNPDGPSRILSDLTDKALLPPDLLFSVELFDRNGHLLESTRPGSTSRITNIDRLRGSGHADELYINRLRPSSRSATWKLQFSRRLNASDGTLLGIVMIMVDADFFVSGYQQEKIGRKAVIGILEKDGHFLIHRTGDTVSFDSVNTRPIPIPTVEGEQTEVELTVSPWDGVRRYTGYWYLYGYPLILMVGLAESEQLASTHANFRVYVWRAAGASALLTLLLATLGRLSWHLAKARQRENEARLAHMENVQFLAYHDSLTTLPNRALFRELLDQCINTSHRHSRQCAILFLDLDRFKIINDTLGHEAGDELLKEIAARLRSCLRDSDTVGRLGGDEFVILVTEFDAKSVLITVARKILSEITRPFVHGGQEFRITVSIGISIYPTDGTDGQMLTRCADIAMYQAKATGRNNFQFYSKELNTFSIKRLDQENKLRLAVENEQFVLHYQPKINSTTGRITGLEALIRWNDPTTGLVPPGQFIPLLEETGLILEVGAWALQRAVHDHNLWSRIGLASPRIAVNVSALQLRQKDFVQVVEKALADSISTPGIDIEITESLLMEDIDHNIVKLKALQAMEVQIAMDDFGTGYSSLAYLARLPIKTVKIDRSFIQTMLNDTNHMTLVSTIISLTHSLGLLAVAEGVEDTAQVNMLRLLHCDELQGYLFSRPIPFDEMTMLLQNDRPFNVYSASGISHDSFQ